MSDSTESSDSDAIPQDVRLLFALIQSRLEHPLTDEQAEQVRGRIARSIALGVALRAYPLTNADEPEIALDPFVGGAR